MELTVRGWATWQGPPGTGKTQALLSLLDILCSTAAKSKARFREMGPILACGDTNAATDNIVEGLHKRGIRVVRAGQPGKVAIATARSCC